MKLDEQCRLSIMSIVFSENVIIAEILLDFEAYKLKATTKLFQTFVGSRIEVLDKG